VLQQHDSVWWTHIWNEFWDICSIAFWGNHGQHHGQPQTKTYQFLHVRISYWKITRVNTNTQYNSPHIQIVSVFIQLHFIPCIDCKNSVKSCIYIYIRILNHYIQIWIYKSYIQPSPSPPSSPFKGSGHPPFSRSTFCSTSSAACPRRTEARAKAPEAAKLLGARSFSSSSPPADLFLRGCSDHFWAQGFLALVLWFGKMKDLNRSLGLSLGMISAFSGQKKYLFVYIYILLYTI